MHSIGAHKSVLNRKFQRGILRAHNFQITIAAGASSGTALIPFPVDKDKTIILYHGYRSADTSLNPSEDWPRLELTDHDTVTAVTNSANAGNTRIVHGQIVVFDPSIVKSVQHVTGVMTAVNFVNVGINSVVLKNSVIVHLGQITNDTGSIGRHFSRWSFTSSTNVQVARPSATNNVTAGACVIEFQEGVLTSNQFIQPSAAAGSATGTAAITEILLTGMNGQNGSSFIFNAGWNPVTVIISDVRNQPAAWITSSTQVTVTRGQADASSGSTMNLFVVEFARQMVRRNVDRQTGISSGLSNVTALANDYPEYTTMSSWLGQYTDTASSGNEGAFGTYKLVPGPDATQLFDRGGTPASAITQSIIAIVFV